MQCMLLKNFAAEFPRHGLAHLLEMYCDVQADKRYQMADWRIRFDFLSFFRFIPLIEVAIDRSRKKCLTMHDPTRIICSISTTTYEMPFLTVLNLVHLPVHHLQLI